MDTCFPARDLPSYPRWVPKGNWHSLARERMWRLGRLCVLGCAGRTRWIRRISLDFLHSPLVLKDQVYHGAIADCVREITVGNISSLPRQRIGEKALPSPSFAHVIMLPNLSLLQHNNATTVKRALVFVHFFMVNISTLTKNFRTRKIPGV